MLPKPRVRVLVGPWIDAGLLEWRPGLVNQNLQRDDMSMAAYGQDDPCGLRPWTSGIGKVITTLIWKRWRESNKARLVGNQLQRLYHYTRHSGRNDSEHGGRRNCISNTRIKNACFSCGKSAHLLDKGKDNSPDDENPPSLRQVSQELRSVKTTGSTDLFQIA